MVWIHGGGFRSGSSNQEKPEVLVAIEDVIVVTLNYRLNIFGFLTNGDATIPGNYGLWDQQLAIQWVKDNIADYGGDTENITLFGESAGGRSVAFQMISPVNSENIFRRGIVESGSAFSLTYINRNPMPVFSTVIDNLNCTGNPNIMSCLRSKSASQLLESIKLFKRPFPFFPIVDGDFLTYDLGTLLSTFPSANFTVMSKKVGHLKNYDLFGGWNSQEGLMYLPTIRDVNQKMAKADYAKGVSREVLREALKKFPFYNYAGNENSRNLFTDMFINFYMSQPRNLVSENRSVDEQRVEIYTEIAGRIFRKGYLILIICGSKVF